MSGIEDGAKDEDKNSRYIAESNAMRDMGLVPVNINENGNVVSNSNNMNRMSDSKLDNIQNIGYNSNSKNTSSTLKRNSTYLESRRVSGTKDSSVALVAGGGGGSSGINSNANDSAPRDSKSTVYDPIGGPSITDDTAKLLNDPEPQSDPEPKNTNIGGIHKIVYEPVGTQSTATTTTSRGFSTFNNSTISTDTQRSVGNSVNDGTSRISRKQGYENGIDKKEKHGNKSRRSKTRNHSKDKDKDRDRDRDKRKKKKKDKKDKKHKDRDKDKDKKDKKEKKDKKHRKDKDKKHKKDKKHSHKHKDKRKGHKHHKEKHDHDDNDNDDDGRNNSQPIGYAQIDDDMKGETVGEGANTNGDVAGDGIVGSGSKESEDHSPLVSNDSLRKHAEERSRRGVERAHTVDFNSGSNVNSGKVLNKNENERKIRSQTMMDILGMNQNAALYGQRKEQRDITPANWYYDYAERDEKWVKEFVANTQLDYDYLLGLLNEINIGYNAKRVAKDFFIKYHNKDLFFEASVKEYDDALRFAWRDVWQNLNDSLSRFPKSKEYEDYIKINSTV